MPRTCLCGHPRTAHQHYRRGCTCSTCRCHTYRGSRDVWDNLAALAWLARVAVGEYRRYGRPERRRW